MRITYLKLINFIGIYNGLGLTEYQLDLSKDDHQLILLQGKNGSGKTTILSMLTPFSSGLDERDSLIIPGRHGKKEIQFVQGEDKITIIHEYKYSKSTEKYTITSYIQKNDTELNPSGTQKTFKDKVRDLFGIDEDYFKLLRIGTNVSNFIDLKPTERKLYISKFLPDVEEFLKYYEIVTKKHTFLKRDIKNISTEIDKYDSLENLEVDEGKIKKDLRYHEKRIEELREEYNVSKGIITSLNPDMVKDKIETLTQDLKDWKEEVSGIENLITSSYSKYRKYENTIDEYLDKVETDYKQIEGTFNSIKTKKEISQTVMSNLKNESDVLLREIKKFEKLDIGEYQKQLERYESQKEKYERNKNENIRHFSFNNIDSAEMCLSFIENIITRIKSDTSYGFLHCVNMKEDYVSQIEKLKTQIEKLGKEYESDFLKVKDLISNRHLKDLLNKRPKDCKIDSCPFISKSLEFKDVDKKIEKLEKENFNQEKKLKELKKEYDDLLTIYDLQTKIRNFYQDLVIYGPKIENLYQFDNTIKPKVEKFFESPGSLLKQFSLSHDYVDIRKKLTGISSLISDRKEYENIVKESIPGLKNEILLLESKNEHIEEKNKKYKTLFENFRFEEYRLGKIEDKYSSIETEVNKYNKVISNLKIFKNLIEKKRIYNKNITTGEEIFKELTDKSKQIDQLLGRKIKIENTLKDELKYIDPLKEELNNINYSIQKINEYQKKLKDFNENYMMIDQIKKSLSPMSGIPLVFIQTYLNEIKTTTNYLLSVAYDDKFFIEKFELTDKDFMIQVSKSDGTIIEDVSLTSQGESSLISVSLTLSLIEQTLKNNIYLSNYKYNILLLDEIDSVLDQENRRSFVDILEKQIEGLGIEQCFIISHNDVFDSYPLLKITTVE